MLHAGCNRFRYLAATAAFLAVAAMLGACIRSDAPASVQDKASDYYGRPKPPAAKRASPRPARSAGSKITVRAGDTLYSIARRHKVPLRAVIDANGLRPPYRLLVGQRLILPVPRFHVVRQGDTVYGIARRYGVGMRALIRSNNIRPPYTIAVAQRLILPLAAPKTASRRRAPPAGSSGALSSPPAPGAKASPGAAASAKPARSSRTGPAADSPDRTRLAPPPRTSRAFLWPVRGRLVSGFGTKPGGRFNDGINIAAPRGTRVAAAANGVVAYAGNELRGYGNLLLIRHAGGWTTAYAHNDVLLVRRGDVVKRGQVVAQVGNTGSVTTPQLHFEIRRGARAVNPKKLLDGHT